MTTKPDVIGEPVIQTPVTEKELEGIMSARERVKALRKTLKDVEEALERDEAVVIKRLQDGAGTTGRFAAIIKMVMPKCQPSWTKAFEKLCQRFCLDAEAEMERVKAEKASTLVEHPNLFILDRSDVL